MPSLRLTILSATSLLLAIGTAALWLRCAVAPQFDFFTTVSPDTSYGLGTERRGIIGFLQLQRPGYRSGVPDDIQVVGVGFRYLRMTSDGMRRYNLVLPFWMLMIFWTAVPCLWLSRRLKARARKRNRLCATCGYDLRASSLRCPECGSEIESRVRPADVSGDPG
ncbi:MAG TPA: hypothetical protein VG269_09900 [Tepidisphaeraceae bacterium]|nr:hypothetical protein [Tepidisphaeraceae bacterium]